MEKLTLWVYFCFEFVTLTFSGLIHILMQAQATILWGFLDTSTKFIYTLSIWIGIILRTLIFAINIFKNRRFIYPSMHIFRVSQIETMYSRDNVFLENRHSLENVYNVFSENTPLKKCPYPICFDTFWTHLGPGVIIFRTWANHFLGHGLIIL